MNGQTLQRLFVAVSLLLTLTFHSYAQWHYGFRSGIDRTRGTSSTLWEREDKWGGTIGGVVKYDFNDWVALQGELDYALRGFKTDLFTGLNGKAHDWLSNFHYINVPVLCKFYPGALPFFIEAGPQLGILAGYGENVKGVKMPQAFYADDFRRLDFSLTFGLGVETELGIFLDFRYDLGLTDVWDKDSFRNRGWAITAGYLF